MSSYGEKGAWGHKAKKVVAGWNNQQNKSLLIVCAAIGLAMLFMFLIKTNSNTNQRVFESDGKRNIEKIHHNEFEQKTLDYYLAADLAEPNEKYEYAKILLSYKDYDSAIKLLDTIRTNDVELSMKIDYSKARALRNISDFVNSLTAYQKVVNDYPNSIYADDAFSMIGNIYYETGDYLGALEQYLEFWLTYKNSDIDMRTTWISIEMCVTKLMDEKKYKGAINFYREFISKINNDTYIQKAHINIGDIYYLKRDSFQAYKIYANFHSKYPHSKIVVWYKIRDCLTDFVKVGDSYVYGTNSVSKKEFLKQSLRVTHETGSYDIVERFNFWSDYYRSYKDKIINRERVLNGLLKNQNFLEAEKLIGGMDENELPTANYLKIKKHYELGDFSKVIDESRKWIKKFIKVSEKKLIADVLNTKIRSQIGLKKVNEEIFDDLSMLYPISINTFQELNLIIGNEINKNNISEYLPRRSNNYLINLYYAQKYFIDYNFGKSRKHLKNAYENIPDNLEKLKRKIHALKNTLEVLDGYYFNYDNEELEGILNTNVTAFIKKGMEYSHNISSLVEKYPIILEVINNKVINVESIEDLFKIRHKLPRYNEILDSGVVESMKLRELMKLLFEADAQSQHIGMLSMFQVFRVPRIGTKYTYNNLKYDYSKILYLVYMRCGFSKETCNTLFINHLKYLHINGIFSVFYGRQNIKRKYNSVMSSFNANNITNSLKFQTLGDEEKLVLYNYKIKEDVNYD